MIFFDNIIFSLQRAGGISTYWGELISRFLRDREEVYFAERENENIVRQALAVPDSRVAVFSRNHILLDRFKVVNVPFKYPFIFHSSYNRVTSNPHAFQVSTVHDFVHEKFYGGLRKNLHSWQKRTAIARASRVIVVSKNTKRDLLDLFPKLDPSCVKVIYNGVSEEFFPISGLEQDALAKPYLLFVGSREHYKNFDLAVKGMRKFKDLDLFLVGGGDITKQHRRLLELELPGRWKHLQGITNSNLNELYNGAFALLYPSSYEGFGIPILEAMRSGCPFIALNKSSIPEVAGPAGILLEDANEILIEQAIEELDGKRNALVELGFEQATKFSWEQCYNETINLYREISG